MHMKQMKMSSSGNSSEVDFSLLQKNETGGMLVTLKWDKINSQPASALDTIGSPSTGRPNISWVTYSQIGINVFLIWITEARTSNLDASHLTNLSGTSVLTNLRRQSSPYLWRTRTCRGDKPTITVENNLLEYLANVFATGKSEDLLRFTLRAPTSVIFRFRQFAFCKIYKQAMNYTIKTNINENWNKMQ